MGAIGDAISDSIEWVADKVSDAISWIDDKVHDIFGSGDSYSRDLGRQQSYDPDTSSAAQSVLINGKLDALRSHVSEESDELEENIYRVCRAELNQLIRYLHGINQTEYSGIRLNLNLKAIEQEQQEILDRSHGFIRKKVIKKVTLDNEACVEILKMDKGRKKEQAMQEFTRSATRGAVAQFSKDVRARMNEQCDSLLGVIQQRIEEIASNADRQAAQYRQIEKMKREDASELQKKQLELATQIARCDRILDAARVVE